MLFETIVPLVVILLLGLVLVWLAWRVGHSRSGWVKWLGAGAFSLIGALFLVSAVLASVGWYRWMRPAAQPAPDLQVESSPDQIARGERLAYLCANCHSSTGVDLPLSGGDENIIEGFATVYAPNLTPAGELASWTDGEIIRAIREGVHKEGRALLVMPSQYFRSLSDEDAKAIVAYLRSQPPVEHVTPPTSLSLPALILTGVGIFPTEVQTGVSASVQAPPAGPTVEYGAYLMKIAYCETCHGPELSGGDPQGFVPVGPPLPALVSNWSPDEFIRTIRTGVDPYGNKLNPDRMPWVLFSSAFSDEELRALYEYIVSLEL